MTATTAATSSFATSSVSVEQLYTDIKNAIEQIGPEPIGEWMKKQNCPPEHWLLILPVALEKELPIAPAYVRFSRYTDCPLFVNKTLL